MELSLLEDLVIGHGLYDRTSDLSILATRPTADQHVTIPNRVSYGSVEQKGLKHKMQSPGSFSNSGGIFKSDLQFLSLLLLSNNPQYPTTVNSSLLICCQAWLDICLGPSY